MNMPWLDYHFDLKKTWNKANKPYWLFYTLFVIAELDSHSISWLILFEKSGQDIFQKLLEVWNNMKLINLICKWIIQTGLKKKIVNHALLLNSWMYQSKIIILI